VKVPVIHTVKTASFRVGEIVKVEMCRTADVMALLRGHARGTVEIVWVSRSDREVVTKEFYVLAGKGELPVSVHSMNAAPLFTAQFPDGRIATLFSILQPNPIGGKRPWSTKSGARPHNQKMKRQREQAAQSATT